MDFREVFESLCPEFGMRGPQNHVCGDPSGLITALGGQRGIRRIMERYVDQRLAESRKFRRQRERQVLLDCLVCAEFVRSVRGASEKAQVQMALF